jgi:large-conductance mechanosensitive channel
MFRERIKDARKFIKDKTWKVWKRYQIAHHRIDFVICGLLVFLAVDSFLAFLFALTMGVMWLAIFELFFVALGLFLIPRFWRKGIRREMQLHASACQDAMAELSKEIRKSIKEKEHGKK